MLQYARRHLIFDSQSGKTSDNPQTRWWCLGAELFFLNDGVALKLGTSLGSTAAEKLVKFQSIRKIPNPYLQGFAISVGG